MQRDIILAVEVRGKLWKLFRIRQHGHELLIIEEVE